LCGGQRLDVAAHGLGQGDDAGFEGHEDSLRGLGFGQDVISEGVNGAQPEVGLGIGLGLRVSGQFREAIDDQQRAASVSNGPGWALRAWRALLGLRDNSYRALFDLCDDSGWQAFALYHHMDFLGHDVRHG
jgi:hypothetical protein